MPKGDPSFVKGGISDFKLGLNHHWQQDPDRDGETALCQVTSWSINRMFMYLPPVGMLRQNSEWYRVSGEIPSRLYKNKYMEPMACEYVQGQGRLLHESYFFPREGVLS